MGGILGSAASKAPPQRHLTEASFLPLIFRSHAQTLLCERTRVAALSNYSPSTTKALAAAVSDRRDPYQSEIRSKANRIAGGPPVTFWLLGAQAQLSHQSPPLLALSAAL